jgi:hypothetical protein
MAAPKLLRVGSMVAVLAATLLVGTAAVTYRAERRLQQDAQRLGVLVELGSLERRIFFTRARNVQLRFERVPGVTAHVNAVTLHGAVLGSAHAKVDTLRLVVTGEPHAAWEALRSRLAWQGLPVSWRQLDIEYSHPLVGKLRFEDVRLASGTTSPSMTAALLALGAVRLPAARLDVDDSGNMLELRLQTAAVSLELRYFRPSSRGALWAWRVPNQPLKPLAALLGWQLGSGFESTRVGGLLSFQPAARAIEHTPGQLQLVFDDWPKPAWPEAEALLGNVAAFSASIEPTRDRSGWELSQAKMSLLVFSLLGRGRLATGAHAALTLDLQGARSCAALQQLLPPSSYSARVQQHQTGARSGASLAAGAASADDAAHLQLRLALQSRSSSASWRLQAGCGIGELSSGAQPGSAEPR